MDKRLFLAIALSLGVLLIWSNLFYKPQLIGNKEVANQSAAVEAIPPSLSNQLPDLQKIKKSSPESLWRMDLEDYSVTFDVTLGAITKVVFRQYQDSEFIVDGAGAIDDSTLSFKKEFNTKSQVKFVHSDNNKKIIKVFTFDEKSYAVRLDISVENIGKANLSIGLPILVGSFDLTQAKNKIPFLDIVFGTDAKTVFLKPGKDANIPKINFAAIRDKYFCVIAGPEGKDYRGFISKMGPELSKTGFILPRLDISTGKQIGHKIDLYIGPQDAETISRINSDWTKIINFGTFDFISQIMLQVLNFLFANVRNWGVAIILLTLIVFFVFFPLTMKQMRSMKEMNALKPHMEELRVTYKDNPQRLNKEMMELYRRHKVNPLGGCLPMILQMPIFLSLYQVIMRSVALKGANFLWIKDLSEPDRLFTLPFSLPGVGNEVNILPLIMALGMFLQQKLTTSASGSSTGQQEKLMMFMFPLMFGIFFYHMPSGLVLYWFLNSLLMLLYQLKIYKAR